MSWLRMLSFILVTISPISAFIVKRDLSQQRPRDVLPGEMTGMRHVYKRQATTGTNVDPYATNGNNGVNNRIGNQQMDAANMGNQPYPDAQYAGNQQQYSNPGRRPVTQVDQNGNYISPIMGQRQTNYNNPPTGQYQNPTNKNPQPGQYQNPITTHNNPQPGQYQNPTNYNNPQPGQYQNPITTHNNPQPGQYQNPTNYNNPQTGQYQNPTNYNTQTGQNQSPINYNPPLTGQNQNPTKYNTPTWNANAPATGMAGMTQNNQQQQNGMATQGGYMNTNVMPKQGNTFPPDGGDSGKPYKTPQQVAQSTDGFKPAVEIQQEPTINLPKQVQSSGQSGLNQENLSPTKSQQKVMDGTAKTAEPGIVEKNPNNEEASKSAEKPDVEENKPNEQVSKSTQKPGVEDNKLNEQVSKSQEPGIDEKTPTVDMVEVSKSSQEPDTKEKPVNVEPSKSSHDPEVEEKKPSEEVSKSNEEGVEENPPNEDTSEYSEESSDVSDYNDHEEVDESAESDYKAEDQEAAAIEPDNEEPKQYRYESEGDDSDQDSESSDYELSYDYLSSNTHAKIFDKFLYDSYASNYDSGSLDKVSWLQSVWDSGSVDDESDYKQWKENKDGYQDTAPKMKEEKEYYETNKKFGNNDRDEINRLSSVNAKINTYMKRLKTTTDQNRDDSSKSNMFLLYSLPLVVLILVVFMVWRNLRGRIQVIKISEIGNENPSWNPDYSKQIDARAKEIEPMLMENEREKNGWE